MTVDMRGEQQTLIDEPSWRTATLPEDISDPPGLEPKTAAHPDKGRTWTHSTEKLPESKLLDDWETLDFSRRLTLVSVFNPDIGEKGTDVSFAEAWRRRMSDYQRGVPAAEWSVEDGNDDGGRWAIHHIPNRVLAEASMCLSQQTVRAALADLERLGLVRGDEKIKSGSSKNWGWRCSSAGARIAAHIVRRIESGESRLTDAEWAEKAGLGWIRIDESKYPSDVKRAAYDPAPPIRGRRLRFDLGDWKSRFEDEIVDSKCPDARPYDDWPGSRLGTFSRPDLITGIEGVDVTHENEYDFGCLADYSVEELEYPPAC